MIVDHAGRLHEGVADGRADEAEATPAQLLAHAVGYRRGRGHLGRAAPAVAPRRAVDEGPQVRIEAARLADQRERGARVAAHRAELEPVADQSRIGQQALQAAVGQARAVVDVEVVEGLAVVRALVEHGAPRQARLRALEAEELEQCAIAVQRHAPFAVVVVAHRVVAAGAGPAAADQAVVCHRTIPGTRRVSYAAAAASARPATFRAIHALAAPRRACRPRPDHRGLELQLDRDEAGAGLQRSVRVFRAALPVRHAGAVRAAARAARIAAAAAAAADRADRTGANHRFPVAGAVRAGRGRRRPDRPARVHDAVLGGTARLAAVRRAAVVALVDRARHRGGGPRAGARTLARPRRCEEFAARARRRAGLGLRRDLDQAPVPARWHRRAVAD